MKKLRKLLAVAAATVISVCALSAPGANAIFRAGKDIVFEGYTECDRNITFEQNPNSEYYANRAFYRGDGKYFRIILTRNLPCEAHFKVADNADLEAVEDIIRAIRPDVTIEKTTNNYFYIYGTKEYGLPENVYNELNLTSYQAKQICNALKEKGYIDNFRYDDCNMSWLEGYFSLPGYFISSKGDKKDFKAYFEETGLDFFVTEEYDNGAVSLDTSLTGKEAIEGIIKIADDTGLKPRIVYFENSENDTEVIDMFDYVDGDANDDGELDLADAVYIMQSIINPDRYFLTAQGSFNADIAGNGDGVTLSDALAVQEILLGK